MIAFLAVKLIVLHLLGTGGLTPSQALEVATEATAHINTQSKYANARIVGYEQIENSELVATLDNQETLLTRIRRHIADKGLRKKRRTIFAVILPPALHDGKRYTGGAAYVCPFNEAPDYAVFYVAATGQNSFGEDRTLHATTAFAHELAHVLCARHDSRLPPTLMNPNALFWLDDKVLPLSVRSRREIKRGWLHSIGK